MDDLTQIRSRIKETIVSCLELPITPSDIDDDALLFAPAPVGGLELDSLAALEIAVGLSKEFQVTLDEVPRESFRSVATLGDFILAFLREQNAA